MQREGMCLVRKCMRAGTGSTPARAKGEKDRPPFKTMMDSASRREFDNVFVWSLDRFSRDGIGKTFDHLRRLGSYGVKFRSYSESLLGPPDRHRCAAARDIEGPNSALRNHGLGRQNRCCQE